MKVLDEGHKYELNCLDGDIKQILQFVKRDYPAYKYPGNDGSYPGTTIQDVLRCCLNRLRYVNEQIPDPSTGKAIEKLKIVLFLLEERAARRHKRELRYKDVEFLPTCKICGHVECVEHDAD